MCGWNVGDRADAISCAEPMNPIPPQLDSNPAPDSTPGDGHLAAPDDAASEAAAEPAAEGGFSGAALTSGRWTELVVAAPAAALPARNPSLPTFAALMTLILTFFIVLTSISINDRKKADAAMASLQETFWGSAMLVPRQHLDVEAARRDFLRGLTGRIQALVPLMGGEKSGLAEDQVLWLPVSLAFAGDATELLPSFEPVLQELLTASSRIPARYDYKLEIRLCAGEAGQLVRLRATSLVAALARLQAPPARFAIGTQACQADRLAFAVALAPVAEANP